MRIVARPEQEPTSVWILVPDRPRRAQGRGAYLHPDPRCLQRALDRGALPRALRLPAGVRVETDGLRAWWAQQAR